jgi:integrase/recombinase XerD
MAVTIRKKKLNDGYVSVFLDIHYKGIRRYEFLSLKYKDKASNLAERQIKKEKEETAKRIALNREAEIINCEYGLDTIIRQDTDFFRFFEDYIEKHKGLVDIRCYVSVLSKLRCYTGKQKLYCREVTESLLERFSKYLQANMNGDTPYNYFKKLKRVIKDAVREKLIRENPSIDIRCPKARGIEKAVLSFEEIKLLNATYCSNPEIKRAFLISCLTGLRFCDIKAIKWRNIKMNVIDLVQAKTKCPVVITLNNDAQQLIGKRKEPNEFVFKLPTHNGCLKVLATWVRKAGIEKRITWHCARHSFATNLIQQGSDILITSKLLGHESLKYTARYTRVSEVLKNDAVNRFPRIL